jgi:hypothetical protein
MARDLKIDAGYEAVPSPQWVTDSSSVDCASTERPFRSVDKWDIGRKRDVGSGVKLLVYMKKTGNRSL